MMAGRNVEILAGLMMMFYPISAKPKTANSLAKVMKVLTAPFAALGVH